MNWRKEFYQIVNDLLVILLSFNNGKPQPWKECFSDFSLPPLSVYHAETRILTNLNYYMINYLAVLVMIILLHIVVDPFVLLLYSLFVFLVIVLEMSRRVRRRDGVHDPDIFFLAVLLSVILLVLILSKRLWTFTIRFLVYCSLVLAHALFRSRSLKSRIAYKSSKLGANDRRKGSQSSVDEPLIDSNSVASTGMTVRTPVVSR
ncbi:hypothetical protein WA538_002767, partial [Blastocystis sp. DL]